MLYFPVQWYWQLLSTSSTWMKHAFKQKVFFSKILILLCKIIVIFIQIGIHQRSFGLKNVNSMKQHSDQWFLILELIPSTTPNKWGVVQTRKFLKQVFEIMVDPRGLDASDPLTPVWWPRAFSCKKLLIFSKKASGVPIKNFSSIGQKMAELWPKTVCPNMD